MKTKIYLSPFKVTNILGVSETQAENSCTIVINLNIRITGESKKKKKKTKAWHTLPGILIPSVWVSAWTEISGCYREVCVCVHTCVHVGTQHWTPMLLEEHTILNVSSIICEINTYFLSFSASLTLNTFLKEFFNKTALHYLSF